MRSLRIPPAGLYLAAFTAVAILLGGILILVNGPPEAFIALYALAIFAAAAYQKRWYLLMMVVVMGVAFWNAAVYPDEFPDIILGALLGGGMAILSGELLRWLDAERKRAEAASRESQERYKSLADSIPDVVYSLDRAGNIITVSGTALRRYGYQASEIVGRPFPTVVYPPDRKMVLKSFRQAIQQHREYVHALCFRVVDKEGSVHWVELNSNLRFDEKGDYVRQEGVLRDFTERKRFEDALRASEYRFQTLIQTAPVAIVAVDLDFNVTIWNAAAERLFGWEAREVLGCTTPLIPPEVQRDFIEKHAHTLLEQAFSAEEMHFRRKDGTLVDALVSTTPLSDDEGNVVGSVTTIEDISGRKQAEEALQDSERRYRLLFEQNPQSMWVFDLETFTFLAVNDAAIQHYGYSRDEFLSMRITDIRPPEDVPALTETLSASRPDLSVTGMWRHKKKDGTIIDVEITANTIPFMGREAVLVLVNDITERKRAEEALRESEQRYRTTIDSMSDAIHVVDTDFRIVLFNTFMQQWNKELGLATDMIGKTVFEVFPFLPKQVRDEYQQVFDTGEVLTTEESTWMGDREFITETRKAPIFEKEKVVRVMTVIRDITERKKSEAETGRLNVELAQRNSQLLVLYDTGRALASTLNLEEIYRVMYLETARHLLEVPYFVISLFDEATRMITCGFAVVDQKEVDPASFPPAPLDEDLVSHAIRTRQPYMVDVDQEHTHPEPLAPGAQADGERRTWSALYLPMISGDRVIGVIHIQTHEPQAFHEIDMTLFSTLANQAAAAIENARLFEEAQRRAEEFGALRAIAVELLTSPDLNQVLRMITHHARIHSGANNTSINVYDRATDRLIQGVDEWQPGRAQNWHKPRPNGLTYTVARTGERMVITDLKSHPMFATLVASEPGWDQVEWIIGLPLKRGDDVVGVFTATFYDRALLTEETLHFFDLLVAQAAASVENARLVESEHRQLHLARTLQAVGALLTAQMGLDDVLDRIFDLLAEVVPYDSASIQLADEAGNLHFRAGRGFPNVEHAKTIIESFAGQPFEERWGQRSVIVLPDTLADTRWIVSLGYEHIRSWIGAPLWAKGRLVGALNVDSSTVNAYNDEVAHTVEAFANQAAIAIENARLHDEAQQRATELEALYRVALQISAELDLDTVLKAILTHSLDILGTHGGGIYLYKPEQDAIDLTVTVGPDMPPTGSRLYRGEGLSGRILESRKPLVVNDYSHWEGRAAIYKIERYTSVLGVPIQRSDKFLGVLNLTSLDDPNYTFTEQHVRLASLLAAQAAVAIENARLFEESRDRAQRLATLNEITRIGTALTDLDALLQALADSAAGVIGGDGCFITLWDAEQQLTIPMAAYGPMRDGYRQMQGAPGDRTLTSSVIKAGHPLAVEDMMVTEYLDPTVREVFLKQYPSRSMLVSPLRAEGRDLGALLIGFNQTHHFVEEEIQWAEQAGELIALAIAKAQAYAGLEQRVAERTAELTSANERLLILSRLKDEFVSNVSHELRTPIASIKLYLHLLTVRPDKEQAYLERLERETSRLDHIIEDLLQLSRMDQGQVKLALEPTLVNEVADQYVTDRAPLAAERRLNLTFKPRRKLPAVDVDRMLLGQALSILLTNALNYTPPGGQVEVSTKLRKVEGQPWVGLSVRDNGPGIPPEEQSQLFQRFYRGLVGRQSGAPGTGLGLAIARQIMEWHHGRIELQSTGTPGQGACFTLWLPSRPETLE